MTSVLAIIQTRYLRENGKCYREWIQGRQLLKEEYVYIHFKKRPNFNVDFDIEAVNSFYITNIGFVERSARPPLIL